MPIVIEDLSGISRGIESGSSALASGLETRAKNRLADRQKTQKETDQKKGSEISAAWVDSYDPNKSTGENISVLQSALEQGGVSTEGQQGILQPILKQAATQASEMAAYNNLFADEKAPSQDPISGPVVEEAGVSETVVQPDGQVDSVSEEVAIEEAPPPPQVLQADRMAKFSDEDLVKMAGHPNKAVSSSSKAEIEKRKLQQRVDNDDRDWHTKFSIKQQEKATALAEAIPKKQAALAHARQAVSSGDTGFLTGNWLAEHTGIEAFRNASGAQLEVAAKEHFFGNMSRVSAKAQNIFFEKLLKNMFAQTGQDPDTANTFLEMLQGELNMDEQYLSEFNKLSQEDVDKFTYPRWDVDQRARSAVNHLEELNLDRTLYRVQRLKESQMSTKQLRKSLAEPVPEGTPITLEKKFMFIDKFGGDRAKAGREIKRLGYAMPKAADLRLYSMSNKEFRKQMGGE